MFDNPAFDGHEEVVFSFDDATGLKAIVAIHNTRRGAALGGCRVWPYATSEEALTDVLRLSRGMTYKAAMADLPLGGGKSVMIVAERGAKTPAMFEALGELVDGLDGRYVVAEDVGSSPADMSCVRRATRHVTGVLPEDGGVGDPSPTTAYGGFIAVRATARAALKREGLSGVHVAVQGLGNVGYGLARHLAEAGARLTVADISPDRVAKAEAELGATSVPPEEIAFVEADIFSPNALGAGLNGETIPRLAVAAIAGCANNQLATEADGAALKARGILYAPDYVGNAGGVIKMCGEYFGWSDREVMRRVERIGAQLGAIFAEAAATGEPTDRVADRIARSRFMPA
ncbi:amino acid dehydrogenase [Acuticoccus sp. M5D2P5]|uniref:Glu/Leu/Phe/Val dehydrogenase dimerization domain-containing protein n=1 Tax=Acuticoccus kalidii TaxID=2910977 RepID=UPI001F2A52E3|nr:Glu/Leu/Phe/Val dehydrogenase dimerization domain-containing protein [Acuticoccus kalidii]MCF3936133.1 amino acid dehydrogenase [Acuticoccus kalidii]